MVNSRIVMWDDLSLYNTPDLSPGKLYCLLTDVSLRLRLEDKLAKGNKEHENRRTKAINRDQRSLD